MVKVYLDLWCDAKHCTKDSLNGLPVAMTLKELSDKALAAGWALVHKRWYCPSCSARLGRG